jgi:hypothetical protein
MPRVPWHLFQDRQARAHLIVAAVEQADVAGDQLNAVQALLKRLVSWQKPAGDYAAMLVRAAGRPESIGLSRMKAMPTGSLLPSTLRRLPATRGGRASAHSSWTARSSLPWRPRFRRRSRIQGQSPRTDYGCWGALGGGRALQTPQPTTGTANRAPKTRPWDC